MTNGVTPVLADCETKPAPAKSDLVLALREVLEPDLAVDLIELGMIDQVHVCPHASQMTVVMALPCFACPIVDVMRDQVIDALSPLGYSVDVRLSRKRVTTRQDMSYGAKLLLFRRGILVSPPGKDEAENHLARSFETTVCTAVEDCNGECAPT